MVYSVSFTGSSSIPARYQNHTSNILATCQYSPSTIVGCYQYHTAMDYGISIIPASSMDTVVVLVPHCSRLVLVPSILACNHYQYLPGTVPFWLVSTNYQCSTFLAQCHYDLLPLPVPAWHSEILACYHYQYLPGTVKFWIGIINMVPVWCNSGLVYIP